MRLDDFAGIIDNSVSLVRPLLDFMKSRLILAVSLLLLLAMGWWLGNRVAGDSASAVAAKAKPRVISKGPALPAPKIVAEPHPEPPAPEPAKKSVVQLLEKLLQGDRTKLTLAQLQRYLDDNHRDAESLVTASQITGDLALLREAATKFPKDPMVLFSLAMRSDLPEERQRAAEAMAAADPNNAMGSYLAAQEAFKSGHGDEAVHHLMEAAARPSLDDYAKAMMLSNEQAYLAAGFSPLEAKAVSSYGLSIPQGQSLHDLGKQMVDLAKSYEANGDTASAQSIRGMGIHLGERVGDSLGGLLIMDLIGQSVENLFLKGMDPNATLGSDGLTVHDRLDQLAARKQAVKASTSLVDISTVDISPALLMQFLDRQRLVGEAPAIQWLRAKLDAGAR